MKKLITVFTFILLFVSISQAQYSFTKSESQKIIKDFKESGFVTRVDFRHNRVYVNHTIWQYQIDAKNKEVFVCLVADYMKYHSPEWNVDGRPPAEIYSNRTAKRLAYWSNWSGINIE